MAIGLALLGMAAIAAQGPAASAPGPSFDCTAAMTGTENRICGDDQLRAMDLGISRFYASARRGRQARRVMREQRLWLSRRNACSDRACLYELMSDRLWDLTETVGRDLPAYVNDGEGASLVIVSLGGDWYAFGALAIWEGPPGTSAAAGGAFLLRGDRGRIPRGNPLDCDYSVIRLAGDRWELAGHPTEDRPRCGAFNVSIEGVYERRR